MPGGLLRVRICPMLQTVVLASGSSGNCLLVETAGTRILIDAGISCKRLIERLREVDVAPESIDGVIITHEHGDHARGFKRFCTLSGVPAYANPATAESLGHGHEEETHAWRLFRTGSTFSIGQLDIETFHVPHDACDPISLVIRSGEWSLGILTDLGHAGHAVLQRVADVDCLVIEANHDLQLLQNDTRRPWGVKQRIISRHGHLSNEAAAEVITHCLSRRLKKAVLGHLSRDCNTAELARNAVAGRINGHPLELHIALQDDPVFRMQAG